MLKTITAFFGLIEILSLDKVKVTFSPDFFENNSPEHDMNSELNALINRENDPLFSDVEEALLEVGYNVVEELGNHTREDNVVVLNLIMLK